MTISERLVRFPHRRSLGNLYIAADNQPEEWELLSQARGLIVSAENQPIKWKWLEEARGTVRIPANHKLKLKINANGFLSLSSLTNIQPDYLHTLDLSNAHLTDTSLAHIENLTGLRVLELTATNVTDESLRYLGNFSKLEALGLSHSLVTSNGLLRLKHLRSLKDLWLSGTRVDDHGLSAISSLQSLIQLGLTGTKVTDNGLTYLVTLSSLLRLYLFNTKVTHNGAKSLRQSLPICRVKWNPTERVSQLANDNNLLSLDTKEEATSATTDSTSITMPKSKKNKSSMTDNQFWQIIECLDWSKSGNDGLVIETAVKKLAEYPVEAICAFADILSEKLFHLDGEVFAKEIGQDAYKGPKRYFSSDWFLRVRCCVIANGKDFYEQVAANPRAIPKDLEFGALMHVPIRAYEIKTGNQFTHVTKFDYETFGNGKAWTKSYEKY